MARPREASGAHDRRGRTGRHGAHGLVAAGPQAFVLGEGEADRHPDTAGETRVAPRPAVDLVLLPGRDGADELLGPAEGAGRVERERTPVEMVGAPLAEEVLGGSAHRSPTPETPRREGRPRRVRRRRR